MGREGGGWSEMTSTMFYSLPTDLLYNFTLGHSLQNNSQRPLIKGRIVFLENKHFMDGKCKTMSKKILAIEGFQREKGTKMEIRNQIERP